MADRHYLDNAATSHPKPAEVARAMVRFLEEAGGNPGRSAHREAASAAEVVYVARRLLARLLGVRDAARVVFTQNATHALNLALLGLLEPGDHVVATSMEHNAVARPLRALEREGRIQLSIVPAGPDGLVDPRALARAVTPKTRLVAVCHGSNVTGALQDLAALREAAGRALFLLDAAQTAGCVPLDAPALGIDLVAVTGHKALAGPQGVGALYVAPGVDLRPVVRGGTGSASESDEQPEFWPDRLEAGTPNAVGLAGLAAALAWNEDQGGPGAVGARERDLAERLWEGLARIPGVSLYGPKDPERRVGVVSFRIAGLPVDEVAWRLDRDFGVAVRVGLHCAPWAHRTIGTFPEGTVRASVGPLTSRQDVDALLEGVARLAGE